jgi:hypothetical protein
VEEKGVKKVKGFNKGLTYVTYDKCLFTGQEGCTACVCGLSRNWAGLKEERAGRE